MFFVLFFRFFGAFLSGFYSGGGGQSRGPCVTSRRVSGPLRGKTWSDCWYCEYEVNINPNKCFVTHYFKAVNCAWMVGYGWFFTNMC